MHVVFSGHSLSEKDRKPQVLMSSVLSEEL